MCNQTLSCDGSHGSTFEIFVTKLETGAFLLVSFVCFFFVAISFNCINVQHTHFLNRYYGNFPLAIWWRVILAGCFCACGYRGFDLIENKRKSALYQMRIDFDHDDDHSTLLQLTFDMSFDHLKMKILSLTAIRFFSLSLGCIIYFARFFLLAASVFFFLLLSGTQLIGVMIWEIKCRFFIEYAFSII